MRIGLIFIIVGLGLLIGMTTTEEEQEGNAFYCEMVKIHKDSIDPHLGWPDYRGIYDEVCK